MKKLLLLLLLFISINSFGQFVESFEAATTVPSGWTVIDGGDAANTWAGADLATSTTIQAQNGTKIFSIGYGATAHDDYLITPAILVSSTTNKLSFWGRSRDPLYPETISVKLSTTTANAAGMVVTLLPSVAPASGSSFYKYVIDLSSYVGQTVYVGFNSTTNNQFRFDIDNVTLGASQTCIEPQSVCTISNVGATTATITWTASSTPPSGGYDIYYSTSGIAPTSSTSANTSVAAGVTTSNLTGLTQSTKYYLYIRSNCGGGSTSVWGPLTVFNSFVDPVSLPYSSGFDSTTELAGWTTAGNNAASMGLGTTAANSNSPSQYWIFNSTVGSANNNWLFCRPISLSAGEVVTVSFWYRTPGARSLSLTVGSLNSATTQTNVIWSNTALPISLTYSQITAPTFTAPTSGVYYFAFNDLAASATAAATLRIDTVNITSVLSVDAFDSSKLIIAPNPATSFINIKNLNDNLIDTVEFVDLNGRIVKTVKFKGNETQINISELSSGVYMMKIVSDKGTTVKKIIKE